MSLSAMIRPAARSFSGTVISNSTLRAGFASSSRVAETGESTVTKKKTISSCPPGTVFKGLNILKDEQDPVAKPDDEYPEWLWTLGTGTKNSDLASKPKQVSKEGEEFDFEAEKKRLKAINKAKIKASNFLRGT